MSSRDITPDPLPEQDNPAHNLPRGTDSGPKRFRNATRDASLTVAAPIPCPVQRIVARVEPQHPAF